MSEFRRRLKYLSRKLKQCQSEKENSYLLDVSDQLTKFYSYSHVSKYLPYAMGEFPLEEPMTKKPNPKARPRKVSGPLYGWRWWLLGETREGWRLHSTVKSLVWEGPTVMAHEPPRLNAHESPAPFYLLSIANISGIHCYNSKEQAVFRLSPHLEEWTFSTLAFGCIEISGRIVKHEDGYRAERATIQDLTVFSCDWESYTKFGWMREETEPTPEQIKDLEETYQVDVRVEHRTGGDHTVETNPLSHLPSYWDVDELPLPQNQEEERVIQL